MEALQKIDSMLLRPFLRKKILFRLCHLGNNKIVI